MSAGTPTNPPATLAARGIERSYGTRAVLAGVDLVRDEPGVVGLLGPNGSGKTTLLRILAQLVEPDVGSVEVCGRVVERSDDDRVRRLVGWAPHEPLAWRDDSIERNLRYAARLGGSSREQARAIADAAIETWNLQEERSTPVRQLSRGWTQRYSFARADLFGPPVLLLDEPTTGLDTEARRLLEDALGAWRPERIVVIASHERAWLGERADQLLDLGAAT